jgi:thymidylate kinase
MTHRIAVVGIDGSGKSELITALNNRLPADSARALRCPDFHHVVDGPLHETSQHLAALGAAADRAAHPAVKAATLYLRMTLFGPVERFVVDTYRPDILFCERHPLVETMVYAPSYELLAGRQTRSAGQTLQLIIDAAEAMQPGTAAAVSRWQALTSSRSGIGSDLETTLGEVVSILSMPFAHAVERMADCYRTRLPHGVIWVDTSVDEAARRLRVRGDLLEVHENQTSLRQLRHQYTVVLPMLESLGVPVHRIEQDLDTDCLVETCLDFARAIQSGRRPRPSAGP